MANRTTAGAREGRDGESRYRGLFMELPDAVLVHDPAGAILDANESMARRLEVPRAALVGRNVAEFVTPENATTIAANVAEIMAGEPKVFETTYVSASGRKTSAEVHEHAIAWGDGRALLSASRDTTERRRGEEIQAFLAQTSSKAGGEPFFNALARYLAASLQMDVVHIGRLEGDGLTARTVAVWCDGKFDDNVTYNLKDTPCGDVLGKTVRCFPASVCQFFPLDQVLRELRAESFVGVTLWSHAAQPIGLIAAIGRRPLTNRSQVEATLKLVALRAAGELERQQAEATLRQREVYLATLLDTLGDVVFTIRMPERRITYVNRVVTEVLGYQPEEMIGQTTRMFYASAAGFAGYGRRLQDALAQGQDHLRVELELRHRDGLTLWADVHTTFLFDAGRPTTVLSVVRDVTARKRAEEALRESEERLRQSQKMDAIGQLAGGVAHDFNNQLTGVLGYADLLSQRLDDPNLKRYAENIRTAARRSADLTAKLLAFARKGQFQSMPVDLHHVINETVDMLERSIDKRVRVEQLLRAQSTVVTGDPSQLQNALLNLGLNARDAMPEGGTLTFETRTVAADAAFVAAHGGELAQGDYVVVTVTDTGCGMSAEVRSHLFEPFFTTKPAGKGTGMGLAAVYGTVKQHKGAVSVSSEVGRGTVFTIYLPLAEPTAGTTDADADAGPHRSATLRILVVDDETLVRELAVEILRAEGHDVLTASDGRAGVELYRAQWQTIDLVILDMVMPLQGGRDAFRAMKAINPRVRAILSSGYSLNEESQAILSEGVLGFVEKPFEAKRLLSGIAAAMA